MGLCASTALLGGLVSTSPPARPRAPIFQARAGLGRSTASAVHRDNTPRSNPQHRGQAITNTALTLHPLPLTGPYYSFTPALVRTSGSVVVPPSHRRVSVTLPTLRALPLRCLINSPPLQQLNTRLSAVSCCPSWRTIISKTLTSITSTAPWAPSRTRSRCPKSTSPCILWKMAPKLAPWSVFAKVWRTTALSVFHIKLESACVSFFSATSADPAVAVRCPSACLPPAYTGPIPLAARSHEAQSPVFEAALLPRRPLD